MEGIKLEHINESPEEFAKKILDRLSESCSYDFHQFFSANSNLSPREIKNQFTLKLLERKLCIYDESNEDEEPDKTDNETVLAKVFGYLNGNGTEVEPNISISKDNYNIIKGYTGNKVSEYVYTLAKRFENMSNATSVGILAAEMAGSTLFAVGSALTYTVRKLMKTGEKIIEALKKGIKSLGLKTVIAVVVIILAELLLYLLLEKPEKVLGIIFNDSDHSWKVNNWRAGMDDYSPGSDLYMDAGEMINFPEDYLYGELSKPVQIAERIADSDPKEHIIHGGIYFADRHVGFYGSEGIMVLTSINDNSKKIALEFSVPYVQDNGTVIEQITGSYDIKSLFNNMVGRRQVRFTSVGANFNLQATMNDSRGGVVGLIAAIDQK